MIRHATGPRPLLVGDQKNHHRHPFRVLMLSTHPVTPRPSAITAELRTSQPQLQAELEDATNAIRETLQLFPLRLHRARRGRLPGAG